MNYVVQPSAGHLDPVQQLDVDWQLSSDTSDPALANRTKEQLKYTINRYQNFSSGVVDTHFDKDDRLTDLVRGPLFLPYLREPFDDDPDSDLCHTCRTIDFERIFKLNPSEIAHNGLPVFQFPDFFVRLRNHSCSACQVFSTMYHKGSEYFWTPGSGNVEHLRAFSATAVLGRSVTTGDFVVLCLLNTPLEIDHNAKLWVNSWKCGFLWSRYHLDDDDKASALKLSDSGVDYQSASRMIRECSTECSHKVDSSRTLFPSKARVIDCVSRRVVALESGMPYLALSYVWGDNGHNPVTESEISNDFEGGGLLLLPNRPQTVEDAIAFVTGIGQRYLWIDKYCIQQNVHAHKAQQIDQMGNIYSHAVATICATGADAKAGLLGLSVARDASSRFNVQSMVVVRSQIPEMLARLHIMTSPWTERGWTYQEALLSQRCLFFTEDSVVQVCERLFLGEKDTDYKSVIFLSKQGNSQHRLGAGLGRALFEMTDEDSLINANSGKTSFGREVRHYCHRSLSHATDNLDAFKGVLGAMNIPSLWGVPIYEVSSTAVQPLQPCHMDEQEALMSIGFVYGLCWFNRYPGERIDRKALTDGFFPSWSWVNTRSRRVKFSQEPSHLSARSVKEITPQLSPSLIYCASVVFKRQPIEMREGDGSFRQSSVRKESRHNIRGPVAELNRKITISSFLMQFKNIKRKLEAHVTGILSPWPVDHYECELQMDVAHDCLPKEHFGKTLPDMTVLLLCIGSVKWKFTFSHRAYFLALRKLADGSFRRVGLLVVNIKIPGNKEKALLQWLCDQAMSTICVS